MIGIDIRGLPEVQRMLRNLAAEQMPFAISRAINNVAFKVLDAQKKEIQSVFDRPTPFIQKSMWVSKATKKKLEATVEASRRTNKTDGDTVWNRILLPHVEGGQRRWRAAEHRLQRAGVLTQGWFAVPAPSAKLDQYGNLPGPMWMMLLSWLNAATWNSQGSVQNRAEKVSKRKNKLERQGVHVFAVPSGQASWSAMGPSRRTAHLKPGIYFRQQNKIRPVVLFVRGVRYQKRLDWYGVGERTAREHFPEAMGEAITRAIRTAR